MPWVVWNILLIKSYNRHQRADLEKFQESFYLMMSFILESLLLCRYNKIIFFFRQRQPTRPHQEFIFCLKLSLAAVTVVAVFCGQWGLQRLPSAVMARLTIMTWRSSGDDMLTWPWHNVTMTRVSLCEAVMSGNKGSLQLRVIFSQPCVHC